MALVTRKIILFIFILDLFTSEIHAQKTDAGKEWTFLIEPYIMLPNMSGEAGMRNLPAIDVEADASDIFSKLQFGAMLYLEAQSPTWSITSDILYMDLEQDATPTTLIKSGIVSAQQLGFELAGLYRIAPFLEAGLGARINNLKSSVEIERNEIGGGSTSLEASLSETWFDPVIITRLTAYAKDRWIFTFRGDFGGFGIGSSFTWQAQGYVGYRFSKLFQTLFGYRIIGIDYDHGNKEDRFRYDMNTFGPNLRIGFNF